MAMQMWLSRRERGFRRQYGDLNKFYRSVYSSLGNQSTQNSSADRGAINVLEFSLDGRYVVAGCQTATIVIYDTRNSQREICTKVVHDYGVTTIKCLDDNTFATGSDDRQVKLWDRRNMSDKLCALQGHSSSVKGLDYASKSKTLLSSGLDGIMFAWNLHDLNETQRLHQASLRVAGMVRCRLSSDEHRLVVSTTGGYMLVINNLNLGRLEGDLRGFKPNIYRTLQYSEPAAPMAQKYRHLFEPKRNRVTIIDNYPHGCDVISSVEIHPKGWCTVCRCFSMDSFNVWTIAHDIRNHVFPYDVDGNSQQPTDDVLSMKYDEGLEMMTFPYYFPKPKEPNASGIRLPPSPRRFVDIFGPNRTRSDRSVEANGDNVGTRQNPDEAQDEPAQDEPAQDGNPNTPDLFFNQLPLHYAAPRRPEQMVRGGAVSGITSGRSHRSNNVYIPSVLGNYSNRSLYYIGGKSNEKSYVIDSCFTSDGRIICEPNYDTIRLLAFNKDCCEPQYAAGSLTQELNVLRTIDRSSHVIHEDKQIICCRFSPIQPLLVSGTYDGTVFFDSPF